MISKGLKTIANVVKNGCVVAAPILGVLLLGKYSMIEIVDEMEEIDPCDYFKTYRYCDAIESILDSGMLSSNKEEAIALIRKGEDSEYYKSIIAIVKSSMLSSDKLQSIRNINN